MKYALIIFETPAAFEARSGEGQEAYWGAWRAFAEAVKEAGVHAGGSGLEPPCSATTVRHRADGRVVQDGPYAETKEQLGGMFVLDVPDLDVALEWAARCPVSPGGAVEVRPALGSCNNEMPAGAAAIREALAR